MSTQTLSPIDNSPKAVAKCALTIAREIAVMLGDNGADVYMDLVTEELAGYGYSPKDLGNAAGSVFSGKGWTFTGRFHKSTRKERKGSSQRIWVYSILAAQA